MGQTGQNFACVIYEWYLGKVESIHVRTTVEDDNTMAWRPTGGIKGVDGSRSYDSFLVFT